MSVSVPTEEQNTDADAPPPAAVATATGIDELRAGQEGLRRAVAETSGRLAGRLRERTAVAARLGLILDSLPVAVVVVDAAGRVLQLSAQAAQLTGAASGEVWSTVLARLTPTAVADEYLLDQRCLRVEQATTPAGDQLYTLADVSAEAARRTGLERERQLVALGQFAAHLAHQLRTPLAAALLHAGLLSHSDLDAGQREQVQALLDRLQHMQAYIGHAFDQLGDHAAAPPAAFALGPFLHGVVASMSGLAARRKVDLRLELPRDCGQITAWRVPLEGALSNLIDNAIHFSPAGGSVLLRAEADAARVRLAVIDQGPGIDRKLLSRIFEPFVSGREGGTGLGLAIARGVVERHGGELRADSQPGFGATFTIELPRQPGGGVS